MFDTVFGLPVHALVVHSVVVLVPLIALGEVLSAWRSTWWDRLSIVLVALGAVAVVSAFVAKSSGEELQARLPTNPDIERHADFGTVTPWAVLTAYALLLAWFVLDRRRGRGDRSTRVVMVVAVVAVVGATLQVVVTGHAGSAAVWADIVEATTPG